MFDPSSTPSASVPFELVSSVSDNAYKPKNRGLVRLGLGTAHVAEQTGRFSPGLIFLQTSGPRKNGTERWILVAKVGDFSFEPTASIVERLVISPQGAVTPTDGRWLAVGYVEHALTAGGGRAARRLGCSGVMRVKSCYRS
jgi:hypothetical protein